MLILKRWHRWYRPARVGSAGCQLGRLLPAGLCHAFGSDCDECLVELGCARFAVVALLQRIVEITGGESLRVNLDIARNNIEVATRIAKAWVELAAGPDA